MTTQGHRVAIPIRMLGYLVAASSVQTLSLFVSCALFERKSVNFQSHCVYFSPTHLFHIEAGTVGIIYRYWNATNKLRLLLNINLKTGTLNSRNSIDSPHRATRILQISRYDVFEYRDYFLITRRPCHAIHILLIT